MLKAFFIPIAALLSFSAFADVSFDEKKNRVEFLEELSASAVSINIDAYRRELEYEKHNLPLDKRAENETNLLAEKIRLQVQKVYEAAVNEKSHEEAIDEVKRAIDKDIELMDHNLRDEIREIAYSSLENVQNGVSQIQADLTKIQKVMLKGVEERSAYLNEPGEEISQYAATISSDVSLNKTKDSGKKTYVKKTEVLESLVSDRESARWISTSSMTLRGDVITKADSRVSVQMRVDFLGIAVEAGPVIHFGRSLRTSVSVMTEGLNPVLLPDGHFDFIKRDLSGNPVEMGGTTVKRFMTFACDANLDFASEYSGGGGFSFAGMGASASVARRYSNSVNIASRRIVVPESVDGKTVTIKFLNDLCHADFIKTKITNTMTIYGSLNMMMRNVLAGVRFSHPKNRCMVDKHCSKWFNTELVTLHRTNNVPRCIEDKEDKFRSCEVRGLRNQKCPVFDAKGRKVSSGVQEYTCDAGLQCVKVQEEGFFQKAIGRCMPVKR